MKRYNMKLYKNIIISVLVVVIVGVGVATCFAFVIPPKDSIKTFEYPSEYFCNVETSYIDYQTNENCSAFASAYVLRCLGVDVDGKTIESKIKRFFGFVSSASIVRVFKQYGFGAKAYYGDINTLKTRLSVGVPIIVFISIPNDTHYAVVVGYDEQNFYLVDSLTQNKNSNEKRYNRIIKAEEFDNIWKTDSIIPNNVYIVAE